MGGLLLISSLGTFSERGEMERAESCTRIAEHWHWISNPSFNTMKKASLSRFINEWVPRKLGLLLGSHAGEWQSPEPFTGVIFQIMCLLLSPMSAPIAREYPAPKSEKAECAGARARDSPVFLFSMKGYNQFPNTRQTGTEKPWLNNYKFKNKMSLKQCKIDRA